VGRRLVVAAVLVVAVSLTATATLALAHGRTAKADCSWGASSISVQVTGGRTIVSGPFTTGCTSAP